MKKILSFITIALLALTCTACGSDPSGISKAEFDEIHTGQTYSDVVDIVGGEGTKVAETEEEFDLAQKFDQMLEDGLTKYDYDEIWGILNLSLIHI